MQNDSITSSFVPFNVDGLELVVNTETGLAYASISATARMLEVDKSTISRTVAGMQLLKAEIRTAAGLKGVALVPSNTVFELAFKYHPGLAKKMGMAGANVYMLGLAGYKVAIEEPKLPSNYIEALEAHLESEKRAVLEAERANRAEAQIEAQAPLVEYAEAVQHSDSSIEIGEFAKMIGTGRNRLFRAMREAGVLTLPMLRQTFANALFV